MKRPVRGGTVHGTNPLADLEASSPLLFKHCSDIATALIDLGGGGKDDHWNAAARSLLTSAIILAVMDAARRDDGQPPTISDATRKLRATEAITRRALILGVTS